jgi:hypothetical protein
MAIQARAGHVVGGRNSTESCVSRLRVVGPSFLPAFAGTSPTLHEEDASRCGHDRLVRRSAHFAPARSAEFLLSAKHRAMDCRARLEPTTIGCCFFDWHGSGSFLTRECEPGRAARQSSARPRPWVIRPQSPCYPSPGLPRGPWAASREWMGFSHPQPAEWVA